MERKTNWLFLRGCFLGFRSAPGQESYLDIPVRQSVLNGSDPNLELLCYSPRVFEILRRARETERLTE